MIARCASAPLTVLDSASNAVVLDTRQSRPTVLLRRIENLLLEPPVNMP
jgi:hypothetical protein